VSATTLSGPSVLAPCICASLLVAACGASPQQQLPLAPGPPSPQAGTYTLSGMVSAAGRAAAGARVVVLEMQPEPSATADQNGHYRISGLNASSTWGRTLIRYSHMGYFTEHKRPDIASDLTLDIDLDLLSYIPLGEVMSGTVESGDPLCAGKEYEEDSCQRFAVITPAAGTLDVTLSSRLRSELLALEVVDPDGQAFAEFSGTPKRVSVPARAGATYEVRVVTTSGVRVEFELETLLR
jgi:hypothetical protein